MNMKAMFSPKLSRQLYKGETIKLQNESGDVKEIKIGMCYGMIYFPFIIPFMRKDYLTGISMLIALIGSLMIMLPLVNVAGYFMSFSYNKKYFNKLKEQGYEPIDNESVEALKRKQYITA